MKYYTYWSILESPNNSISSSSIFLIILIASLSIFILILKFKKTDFEKKLYLSLTSLFILLSFPAYIYLKFMITDNTEKRLNDLLNSDRVLKVEGQISNFRRDIAYPRNGKNTRESFNIDSVNFTYIDNALYEFHHFGGNNSDIFHNGLNVRITYIKGSSYNEIQKIEIAE